jgi:hypothetical protein
MGKPSFLGEGNKTTFLGHGKITSLGHRKKPLFYIEK